MKTLAGFALTLSLACAGALPTAAPEQAGLSPGRLARVNAVMRQHVESGRLAGASGLIARDGKVVFRETWGDLKPDSIVRMYSMTKAVTGVAAMILYEEGRFALSEPLSKYLPEFKEMRVARESTGTGGKRIYYTVPADRAITIRDLFRHTSGLDYNGPRDETGEFAYKKLGLQGGAPKVNFDLAEAVRRLAGAPLVDQPGTTWRYGYSVDILGRLVEVTSGQTLDRFCQERIFAPLGMKDSGFFVPEEKWNRLAVLYAPKKGGGIERSQSPAQESFKKKPVLLLGGAGLVSTLDDYARFCMMLLNGGQLDGARILGRKSVELMRSDHLGKLARTGGALSDGDGFGLTFAINLGPGKSAEVGSEGTFRWSGAAGTTFWIDPKEHMIAVFLIQVLPPRDIPAGQQFMRLSYQALVD
ncbi:MAG: beta-lactamase family protein [Acidobacteria bacterium]|nr:beta-lactamase family protein [Acidobacteriota bacterium]